MTNHPHDQLERNVYLNSCIDCVLQLRALVKNDDDHIYLIEPIETKTRFGHMKHIDEIIYRDCCHECKKTIDRVIMSDDVFKIHVKKADLARVATSSLIKSAA